tara:strand:- start:371 stop:721 length:351 start_codon:yes stop_codon:yes gene_type:complete
MTTQVVTGLAKTQTGYMPLKTTITDGSDSQELKGNSDYLVTSQSLGTFMENQTLTHLTIQAATGIAYAGVLRNGQYIALCQSLGSKSLGGMNQLQPIVPAPVRLVAGDQIIVRTEA